MTSDSTTLAGPNVIQVNILEDSKDIVQLLESKLKPPLRKSFPKFDIKFLNQNKVEDFKEEIKHNNKIEVNILDLDLGNRTNTTGLDAYDSLRNQETDGIFLHPIIFTAKLVKYRKEINERNIPSNYIIEKPLTKDGHQQMIDILRQQVITLNNLVQKHLNNLQVIQLTFHELPDFDNLSLSEKIFVSNALLIRYRSGINYLARDEHAFEFDSKRIDNKQLSEIPADHTIRQFINEDNEQTEGIQINYAGKSLTFLALDLRSVRTYLLKLQEKEYQDSELATFLLEAFLVQRLADLYHQKVAAGKSTTEILDVMQSWKNHRCQAAFINRIWEAVTINETGDIEATNRQLNKVYELGFPIVKDIFYAQVEAVVEEDVLRVRMYSVEDLETPVFKSFHRSDLQDAAVSNLDACFKLIILEFHEKCDIGIPGKTFFIEPITYHQFDRLLNLE